MHIAKPRAHRRHVDAVVHVAEGQIEWTERQRHPFASRSPAQLPLSALTHCPALQACLRLSRDSSAYRAWGEGSSQTETPWPNKMMTIGWLSRSVVFLAKHDACLVLLLLSMLWSRFAQLSVGAGAGCAVVRGHLDQRRIRACGRNTGAAVLALVQELLRHRGCLLAHRCATDATLSHTTEDHAHAVEPHGWRWPP